MNTTRVDKSGFDQGRFDFVSRMGMFFWVSTIATVLCFVAIFVKGINYGIDFTGGVEVQVKFQQPLSDDGQMRTFLAGIGLENASVQKFGKDNEYLIRFDTLKGADDSETNRLQKERIQKVTEGLNATFAANGAELRRVDAVGPQIGSQLKRNGLLAVFYCLIAILIYIGLRFDYNFAPGAVICLFHDVILVLGIFAVMGIEFNGQILAAILTIIGYDINDTIVVFDRIRENIGIHKGVSIKKIINRSTNETLSRTILTGGTTLTTCLVLMYFAGGVIADFAFALFLGIIFGTYSSIYIASPLIIYFEKIKTGKTSKVAA